MLYLIKMQNREIEDCDDIGGMCILELKVLQKLHLSKISIASKPIFFKPQLQFVNTESSLPVNSLD